MCWPASTVWNDDLDFGVEERWHWPGDQVTDDDENRPIEAKVRLYCWGRLLCGPALIRIDNRFQKSGMLAPRNVIRFRRMTNAILITVSMRRVQK